LAKKTKTPRRKQYKTAAAFDLTKQDQRGALWLQRISRAWDMLDIKARRDWRSKAFGYLDGSYAEKTKGERVYLNEALPAIEDMVFGTVPALPPVQVEARQLGQEDLADAVASLVDATLSSGLCRALKALIRAEWDELTWGIGFIKTAWLEEDRPQNVRLTQDEEYLTPHYEMATWENLNPTQAVVGESDDDAVHLAIHAEVGEELEEHIAQHYARLGKQRMAHPVLHVVPPERLVYDPDATEWEEWGWVAELCDELVSGLENIPGIKNLNPENCPSVDEFDNKGLRKHDAPLNNFDFENTRVRVWKIHDRHNGRYVIVPAAENGEVKPLLETDWPYGSLDIYRPIVHRPHPERVHGFESLRLILPILDELARTNASIRKHNRRAANAKPIAPRGATDKQFEQELADPDRALAHGPIEAVAMMKEFKPPSVPQELIQHREMLLSEIRRMLGSDIISQGGDTPHEISATEAAFRGKEQGDRLGRRKQEVSEALSWAAKNIVLLYRDWAEEGLTVRVMGPEGVIVKSLDPASIPADLTVQLDIEAATEAFRSQDLQAKQVFVDKVMAIAPDMANRMELLMMLADTFGVRNAEKFFLEPGAGVAPAEAGSSGTIPFPKQEAGGAPLQNQPSLTA